MANNEWSSRTFTRARAHTGRQMNNVGAHAHFARANVIPTTPAFYLLRAPNGMNGE